MTFFPPTHAEIEMCSFTIEVCWLAQTCRPFFFLSLVNTAVHCKVFTVLVYGLDLIKVFKV